MHFLNCYLCETCMTGLNLKDDKVMPDRICPTCGNKLHYSRTLEFDDNNNMIREYLSNGNVIDTASNPNQQSRPQPAPKPTITCPYCNSTNCKKLGVISRGVSFGIFGMGSSKIGKNFHCNSCGADF